jgi:hypothetical protein
MNSIEQQLASRMHGMVEDETGAAPTEVLLVQGRSALRRRRAKVGGAVVAAAVAIGAVAGAVSWSAPSQAPPGQAQQDDTPAVRLAAAVAASDNISYRVRVSTRSVADSERGASEEITEGAFDPATRTGYLNEATPGNPNAYLERLVDGVRYVGCANCDDKWKQYPGTHDRLAYAEAMNAVASASADPEALFEAFTQAGAKITQTDTGFHFVVNTKDRYGENPVALVGDVKLGADNRIASVTYEETITVSDTRDPNPPATTTTDGAVTTTDGAEPTTTTDAQPVTKSYSSTNVVTVELFDYGTPVSVERPTDVVVMEENK